MSDEIKKTVLNTLAEPIANSAKNITDKPTQNIGTTLADIWYLVFGGISQAADKKKLKYSYALQKMENELQDSISKIPQNKLIEPDIQIIAQALEASKYCVEKEELRHMFVKLISNSLNKDSSNNVHPIYVKIISNLTPFDAKVLLMINQHKINSYLEEIPDSELKLDDIVTSICVLEKLGLIYFNQDYDKLKSQSEFLHEEGDVLYISTDNLNNVRNLKLEGFTDTMLKNFIEGVDSTFSSQLIDSIIFTKLGLHFIESCL